jgi:hypothetical protein
LASSTKWLFAFGKCIIILQRLPVDNFYNILDTKVHYLLELFVQCLPKENTLSYFFLHQLRLWKDADSL